MRLAVAGAAVVLFTAAAPPVGAQVPLPPIPGLPGPQPEPEPGPPSSPKPEPTRPAPSRDPEVRYVSPHGSDRGPGTRARPWRTLQHAVRAFPEGGRVYLAPGRYGRRHLRITLRRSGTARSPLLLSGLPGRRRPVIRGQLWIAGDHVTVRRVRLIGPTGNVRRPDGGESNPLVLAGDHTALLASEVARSAWHAGVFVYNADDVSIIGNHVHDNGARSDTAHANLDHGIYWGSGSRGVIANNLIVANVAHGVQLYPKAHRVLVTGNTIVGHGRAGVMIGGQSSQNLVVNNVIVSSADVPFRSSGLRGAGNTVRRNVVWGQPPPSDPSLLAGLAVSENTRGDPLFAGTRNFRILRGSAASDFADPKYALPFDFSGRARSRQRPDAGAFEVR